MIKVVDYDVTFREVPNEISLALNISNCPYRCKGCHSPHLQHDTGYELTTDMIDELISKSDGITCITFMGGDANLKELEDLLLYIKNNYKLKTAWYSGNVLLPEGTMKYLNYIKIGPYIPELGGLDKPTTNQILYEIGDDGRLIDITYKFRENFVDD